MAILKIRDENGNVREMASLKGDKGDKGDTGEVTYLYAHRNLANALKGTVTGNPAVITDASPLEHGVTVNADVGGATVTKYGKNLFTVQDGTLPSGKQCSYDSETQVLTVPYGNTQANVVTFDSPLPVGTTFSITVKMISGKTQNHGLCVGGYHWAVDSNDKTEWQGQVDAEKDIDLSGKVYTNTYTAKKTVDSIMVFMYGSGNVIEPLVFQVQFELGGLTDYEPYQEPTTYTADENGAVNGITASGECMTLFADSGVTITAEYSRDINKAFTELSAKITEG